MNIKTLQVNNEAIVIIKHYESLHDGNLSVIGLQPKMCPAKIWTVGYGRALFDPVTLKVLKGAKDEKRAYEMYPALTEEQAENMLLEDIDKFSVQLERLFKTFKVDLKWNEFSAIVSFVYNIGYDAFVKSNQFARLRNGNKEEFAKALLLFNRGGGVQLPGLTCRRLSERDLFVTGKLVLYSWNRKEAKAVAITKF
jgi:lysozyme